MAQGENAVAVVPAIRVNVWLRIAGVVGQLKPGSWMHIGQLLTGGRCVNSANNSRIRELTSAVE
eukprot:7414428-Lingulodinium_polyedra.AAC.1